MTKNGTATYCLPEGTYFALTENITSASFMLSSARIDSFSATEPGENTFTFDVAGL